jgi:hypothetical protein
VSPSRLTRSSHRTHYQMEETNMPQSTIQVRKHGKPVSGARVVLSFSGGQTHSAYTDSDGYAKVNHDSTGEATIFVDGSDERKMRAPGSATVSIN